MDDVVNCACTLDPTASHADGSGLAWRLAEDRAAVDELYGRLDALSASTAAELDEVLRESDGLSPQDRAERDAHASRLGRRLVALRSAERRLLFGRLDLDDGSCLYIGRLGLRRPGRILIDWRAPAAAAFYQATPAAPGRVLRRRHLHLDGRRLADVTEEVLTFAGSAGETPREDNAHDPLTRVLAAPRTGRMRDIVATLQAEQDRIIRSSGRGVLVVTGAPGTGKTVVALHRAAYLLYSEPARRAGGVLVVGPNPAYLRYIEQVLPALGETDVVLAQPADLYPVDQLPLATEDPATAGLKGDERMAAVLRRAVEQRQRRLRDPLPLLVDGAEIVLWPEVIGRARQAARASGEPHNQARDIYAEIVLADLVQQLLSATADGADHAGEDGAADLRSRRTAALAALHRSPDVRREINLRWMPLTPEKVLRELYADQDRLRSATPGWSADLRTRLARRRDAPWTPSDVPLLDELAALLGPPPPSAAQRAADATRAAARREAVLFAGDTLRSYGVDALGADVLVHRYGVDDDDVDHRSLADRATTDASWAFGHVVVDEAQDLTPMQWRMVLRRCPSRSMTVVGDLHQRSGAARAGDAAGRAQTWADVLGAHLRRWREETLTVNYRTPGEHLAIAHDHLRAAGLDVPTVESARWGGIVVEVDLAVAALSDLVERELECCRGTLAVVAADPREVQNRVPVSVVTPAQVKGLEFDTVIVIGPDAIGTRIGPGDLYVGLTRATQRLVLARIGHGDCSDPHDGALGHPHPVERPVEGTRW